MPSGADVLQIRRARLLFFLLTVSSCFCQLRRFGSYTLRLDSSPNGFPERNFRPLGPIETGTFFYVSRVVDFQKIRFETLSAYRVPREFTSSWQRCSTVSLLDELYPLDASMTSPGDTNGSFTRGCVHPLCATRAGLRFVHGNERSGSRRIEFGKTFRDRFPVFGCYVKHGKFTTGYREHEELDAMDLECLCRACRPRKVCSRN